MAPNWFIGLPVSLDLVLEAPSPAVRVFVPEDRHATLVFLGHVDEPAAQRAFAATLDALPLAPCAITLERVVALGPRGRESALSALLGAGRHELEHAIARVRDPACDGAGIARERRPPLAHITLARIARKAERTQRESALRWAEGLPVGGTRARLHEVALYTWSADRRERQFRIARSAPLALH